jgi:hypothetical protein
MTSTLNVTARMRVQASNNSTACAVDLNDNRGTMEACQTLQS